MTMLRQSAGEQMRHRRSGLHSNHLRIERAQTHCTREALIVWCAAGSSLEAAQTPGSRQVRIGHQGPVKQCDAAVEIAAEMAERMTASGEGNRRQPGQASCSTAIIVEQGIVAPDRSNRALSGRQPLG
jgi:hypothetical protein